LDGEGRETGGKEGGRMFFCNASVESLFLLKSNRGGKVGSDCSRREKWMKGEKDSD